MIDLKPTGFFSKNAGVWLRLLRERLGKSQQEI